MEMRFSYFLWALLPIVLFIFSAGAGMQKARKLERQEPGKYYLQQAIFSLLLFFVAIGIDVTLFDNIIAPNISLLTSADPGLFRWLLYPGLLTAAVLIRDVLDRKSPAR